MHEYNAYAFSIPSESLRTRVPDQSTCSPAARQRLPDMAGTLYPQTVKNMFSQQVPHNDHTC